MAKMTLPLALLMFALLSYAVARGDDVVARLSSDLAQPAKPAGWALSTARGGVTSETSIGALTAIEPAAASGTAGALDKPGWRVESGRLFAQPGVADGAGVHAVATYTLQSGQAGFYSVCDSLVRRGDAAPGRVELRVYVRRAGSAIADQLEPAVYAFISAGELFDFDIFLGYLDVGDSICVSIGPDGDATGDATEIDYHLARTDGIPVSQFASVRPAGDSEWMLARGVPEGALAERIRAWGPGARFDGTAGRVHLSPADVAAGRETMALFRVPHSGYYAMHDASADVVDGAANGLEARIYAGRTAAAKRVIAIPGGRGHVSLNTDLGYLEKGTTIAIAIASRTPHGAEVDVVMDAKVVEWAPRRAPLRAVRGKDGFLNVREPAAANVEIDIPATQWVVVPPQEGDATEAIRAAFTQAKSLQRTGAYAGVRLQRGVTYNLATEQVGGDIFMLRDLSRIVFDGNGATLRVRSPEMARRGVRLFVTHGSRSIVIADFTVESTSVPFSIGRVLAVSPMERGNQTVTFRVEPGTADPIADIARNGRAAGYCYDPLVPGRLALGAWSHYPGAGSEAQPELRATSDKSVFEHTVTRTGGSIAAGSKWLVKNKGAGLTYLTTGNGSEDITLYKVICRASGGSLLLFWQTSGINLLECSYEPAGENWLASSSDAIHGRGREGVWIEDTTIRGVCEDTLNTYGQTMVVVPDDNADDSAISLRMLQRAGTGGDTGGFRAGNLGEESVLAGDKLVFFNPNTGQVLGHAIVRDVKDERVTLSNPVPGIDTWERGDDRRSTMVYNTASAARFVIRDSRWTDSMRFAAFIKAQRGVIFNSTFDGMAAPPVFVANEPEWPEGPPSTDIWLQGNTFSYNSFDYQSRHRAFLVVDPAAISIYTRKFRTSSDPEGYRGSITRGEHANSHMKIIGNTFHDWRGMGIAVRNSRNVQIRDNLFLPTVADDVMRATLAKDAAMSKAGGGAFAAIFLDSVSGVRMSGNRYMGLLDQDQPVVSDEGVTDVVAADNEAAAFGLGQLETRLRFSEWLGDSTVNDAPATESQPTIEMRGATFVTGRIGSGVAFNEKAARVLLSEVGDATPNSVTQLSVALWVRLDRTSDSTQIVYAEGDDVSGVVIAIDNGQLVAGILDGKQRAWIDLGPAIVGLWQHVCVVYDGNGGTMKGYVDGIALDTRKSAVPARLTALKTKASFGGASYPVGLGADRIISAAESDFHGAVDEFHRFGRAITATETACLALRLPAAP